MSYQSNVVDDNTLSHEIMRFAQALGVDRCFTVVGGMAMHLNYALAKSTQIRATFTHHETSAIAAAEGYAKAYNCGRPGMALITSGPGVTNALTGMASCFGDSVPTLVLAGQVKQSDIGHGLQRTHGIQEVEQLQLASSVSKLAMRVSAENYKEAFQEAWSALTTGRRGPVYMEFPLDQQAQEVENWQPQINQEPPQRFSLTIGEKMGGFERPVVLIGNGMRIHRSALIERIGELESRNIPRLYTTQSMDLEPFANSGHMGFPGQFASTHSNRILSTCDLLITLGARLDLATTAYQPDSFGAQAERLLVDIDPSELQKFSATRKTTLLAADGLVALNSLLVNGLNGNAQWMSSCAALKEDSLQVEDQRLATDTLTVRNVALTASLFSENRHIVPASSGTAIEFFTRFFRPGIGTTFFNGASLGAMGLGLSHGVGAALSGSANQGVWIFEGDGGLWMGVHEIATLVENVEAGCVLFVLSNGGYASIQRSQANHFAYEFGASGKSGLFIPDWERVAEAVGLPYLRVNTLTRLQDYMSSWDPSEVTSMVEICLEPSEESGPLLKTKLVQGRPQTPSLDALSWS